MPCAAAGEAKHKPKTFSDKTLGFGQFGFSLDSDLNFGFSNQRVRKFSNQCPVLQQEKLAQNSSVV